ncbi:DUF4038 domain-containing protein [Tistrella mobilis]|uniref:Apiosidase-like catalytic domain-containing protein n=1 Tax=Tistrella mobilis TaxID=171437 RepID=A0A162JV99_9PROT|nr:DUF4038 domain-containing protein [Tistrella mobilis]KYO49943.1 hypothetical protein AUP44_15560 [Tistrella mobilis]
MNRQHLNYGVIMRNMQLFVVLCLVMVLSISAQARSDTCRVFDHLDDREMRALETADGHFVTSAGQSFLWVGDTAWSLLYDTDCDGVITYLDARAAQGFNVIQVVLIAKVDRVMRDGTVALSGLNGPETGADVKPDNWQISENVMRRLDDVIDAAARRDIQVAVAVLHSSVLYRRRPIISPDFAAELGRKLGERYAGRNVVWFVTHDAYPRWYPTRKAFQPLTKSDVDAAVDVEPVIDALGEGLVVGSGGRNLVSAHPQVGISATWYANKTWHNFVTIQSGHKREKSPGLDSGQMVARALAMAKGKPVVEAELGYEDIADNLYDGGRRKESDVVPTSERLSGDYVISEMIRAYLAGAAGAAYGHYRVAEFWEEGDPVRWPPAVDWRDALQSSGANAVRNVRALFEKYTPWSLRPFRGLRTEDRTRPAVETDLKGVRVALLAAGDELDPSFVGDARRVELHCMMTGAVVQTHPGPGDPPRVPDDQCTDGTTWIAITGS